METIFDYKDLGLASYLLLKGNKYIGVNIRYSNKFNEYKVYVSIQGNRESLINLKNQYDENKVEILRDANLKHHLNILTDEIDRSLKN